MTGVHGPCRGCEGGDRSMVHSVTVDMMNWTTALHRFCLHTAPACSVDTWAFRRLATESLLEAFNNLWYPHVPPKHSAGVNLPDPPLLRMSVGGLPQSTINHLGHRLGHPTHGGPTCTYTVTRPSTSTTATAKKASEKPVEVSYLIWLFPVPGQYSNDLAMEHPEIYSLDLRLFSGENATFCATLWQSNLILKFAVPLADGSVDRELSFYSEVNASLTEFMAQHHFRFSGVPKTPSASSVSNPADINTSRALELMSHPWTVLGFGNKPQLNFRRKIFAADILWYNYKISALKSKAIWSLLPDFINPDGVLHFIGKWFLFSGIRSILTSCRAQIRSGGRTLPGRASTLAHSCLALHLQHALGDLDTQFTPIECLPMCLSSDAAAGPSSTTAASTVQSPYVSASQSSLWLDAGPLNSEDEDDQVMPAIRLSASEFNTVHHSSSTAGAGPSHLGCPLPQPPTASIRPRSESFSPPLSVTRRRLDPPTINLTRSPSPTETEFHEADPGDPTDQPRDTKAACVTTPTTQDSVSALLTHIESFYGGPSYSPNVGTVDAVHIEPAGPFGLFAKSGSWKNGESIGVGVGKTIMSELMNKVFSDKDAWKAIGDTLVLKITPIASNLDDEDFLYDTDLTRMYAPKEMAVLDLWPPSLEEFEKKKKDPTLTTLAIQYFDGTAEIIAGYSKDKHYTYTVNSVRQVLFGCPTRFSKTEEYHIFAEALNGPISEDSPLTLGQTFGTSRTRKSLLHKLIAGRVKSPQEVIQRLSPSSAGKGKGRVNHPLLPVDKMSKWEKNISHDNPLVRLVLFLMFSTGTVLLPDNKIDMVFVAQFPGQQLGPDKTDPKLNPEHWPIRAVAAQLLTILAERVDLPLFQVASLLEQPIPGDTTTSTDFDLYQYIGYRPITEFAEFGGLSGSPISVCPKITIPLLKKYTSFPSSKVKVIARRNVDVGVYPPEVAMVSTACTSAREAAVNNFGPRTAEPGTQEKPLFRVAAIIIREALSDRRKKAATSQSTIFSRILTGLHLTKGDRTQWVQDQMDPICGDLDGLRRLKEGLPFHFWTTETGLSSLLVFMGARQGSACIETFTVMENKASLQPATSRIKYNNPRIYGQPNSWYSLHPSVNVGRDEWVLLTLWQKFEPYFTDELGRSWRALLGPLADQDPQLLSSDAKRMDWEDALRWILQSGISGFGSGLGALQFANNIVLAGITNPPSLAIIAQWIDRNKNYGAFAGLQDKETLHFGAIFAEQLLCKVVRWRKVFDSGTQLDLCKRAAELLESKLWIQGANLDDHMAWPIPSCSNFSLSVSKGIVDDGRTDLCLGVSDAELQDDPMDIDT
ncbi:hypothetical protein B0H17DRAFT_1139796 [Mycena rosella]|uniref:Uncharacterized protein n=1 Tax=Mycena rosella TaxID=1033263 RepID=A0AAD7D3E4_MYCRO|nr:hypothetical protein B0H17DRAFT_1139796 [Mycena rosella]